MTSASTMSPIRASSSRRPNRPHHVHRDLRVEIDRRCASLEVKNHQQDIDQTKFEIAHGSDQSLRTSARRDEPPMLEMHLDLSRRRFAVSTASRARSNKGSLEIHSRDSNTWRSGQRVTTEAVNAWQLPSPRRDQYPPRLQTQLGSPRSRHRRTATTQARRAD